MEAKRNQDRAGQKSDARQYMVKLARVPSRKHSYLCQLRSWKIRVPLPKIISTFECSPRMKHWSFTCINSFALHGGAVSSLVS